MKDPRQHFIAIETDDGGGTKSTIVHVEPDDIRLILTVGFSALFIATIIIALVLTFWPGTDSAKTWTTMKDVLGVLLPAETGLLGSIVGFYFGSKTAERKAAATQRVRLSPTVE